MLLNGEGISPVFLIMMGVAVVALLFMSSRGRKRQAEAVAFRKTLAPGQHVMTTSGMFGTVTAVVDDKVTLVSSGGQESEWLLAAIAKLVEDEPKPGVIEDTTTPTQDPRTEGDTPPPTDTSR